MGNKNFGILLLRRMLRYILKWFFWWRWNKSSRTEGEFAELNGWEAETEAENITMGLKIGSRFTS